MCVVSVFRREGDEKCFLLDYYAASNGNFLPTLSYSGITVECHVVYNFVQ